MTGTAATLSIESFIKAQAVGLGFDLVGIARLGAVETAPMFEQWLARGYAGEMEYLHRGAEKRRDARLPFASAVSAIVVALDYGGRQPSGPIARYARGDDYHELITKRLDQLHRVIETEIGRTVPGKAYVDTGPILERDLARKAGLGWFGKSTNLVNPKIGSFFFIGSLLLDMDLEPDAPFEPDRCGSCTRCIDACPTGAIVDDRVVDATRCISYLTIEKRGDIPEELAPMIGEHLYGCDICQDVCPWNVSFAQELKEPAFTARPAIQGKDARTLATEIAQMDEEIFRESFRGSPMKRAKHAGLVRNARIVLKNLLVALVLGVLGPSVFAGQARGQSVARDSAAVHFVQGMMQHHAQAIVMGRLVPTHTSNRGLRTAARRIVVSQTDEIALMQRWLERRHATIPAIDTSPPGSQSPSMGSMGGMNMDGMDMGKAHDMMPGMLTQGQLRELARARGTKFDSLFLRFMVAHHEGALKMVADLFAVPGATNDPELFQLASDIDADQRAEIARMRRMGKPVSKQHKP